MPDEGAPRLREANERTRGHRKCSSGINKAIVDYGSDIAPELRCAEEGEELGRDGGIRGMAEGQGEDGPGSVGDSGATPMIVVVVLLDDGGGRRGAVRWSG